MAGEPLESLVAGGMDRAFDLTPDPLCILDAGGNVRQMNSACRQLFGMADSDLERHFSEHVHPDERAAVSGRIARLAGSGEDSVTEFQVGCRGDGSRRVFWRMQRDRESGLIYASGRLDAVERVADGERQVIQRPAQFFESILYNLGDIVYAWNRENQFIYGNRRLEEIWGLSPDEFIGKTPAELGYPPELQELFARQIEQVFETRMPARGEIPYTSPSGEFGYFEYMFSPVFDVHGNVELVGGVSRNTTRRRQTEDALRESEAALSESEARQAFLLELSDRLRTLSEPHQIMTTAAEAIGRHLGVSQVGYCEIEDDQETAVAGGEFSDGRMPSFVGYRFQLSDYGPGYGPAMRAGDDIYYDDMTEDPRAVPGGSEEMRAMRVRAGAGLPLVKQDRLVAFLYALSPERRTWSEHDRLLLREVAERTWAAVERARAETELRESEARFRESVEIATVGVIFFDLQGRITDANDAFLQMSGFTQEDLEAGRLRWDDMTPPEWMPASWQAISEMESSGHTTPYEKEYIRKDGSRWWALFAAKSLGRHGNIEFVIDITERKQADEERERLLAETEYERRVAEDAVRARDVFLSIASHELRNPLATIKASSQLLERLFRQGTLDEERGGRLMKTLTESSARLAILVDDLLDVSRLASGQMRIDLRPVNFAELVQDTIAEQRGSIDPRSLHLDIHDGHVLELDVDRMRQVLVNILDNAVKYSPPDSELHVSLTYDDEGAVLSVQDQGIGVPADALESIFEPFGRAPNAASSNIPGMGLGLYICRRIVEAHHGQLWAESAQSGVGTSLCLRLPVADTHDGS